MNLKQAATYVLRPHVAAMRSYASTNPMPSPPERRGRPSATLIWRCYLTSMITVQTRSTADLWQRLGDDPAWHALRGGGPLECPSESRLASFLKRHRAAKDRLLSPLEPKPRCSIESGQPLAARQG